VAADEWIYSRDFIANMDVLTRYLEAVRESGLLPVPE
jgi:hypothetical protein